MQVCNSRWQAVWWVLDKCTYHYTELDVVLNLLVVSLLQPTYALLDTIEVQY